MRNNFSNFYPTFEPFSLFLNIQYIQVLDTFLPYCHSFIFLGVNANCDANMDGMRRYGMALHDSDEYEGHLLHQAAIFDNVELLESLLEGEAVNHINACDPLNRTPLYMCVTQNSLKCAKLLINNGGEREKIILDIN